LLTVTSIKAVKCILPLLFYSPSYIGERIAFISLNVRSCDTVKGEKCKAIPLQAWTRPEVSRRLRLPDFKEIGT